MMDDVKHHSSLPKKYTQVVNYGKVISNNDPMNLGRIRVEPVSWQNEDLYSAFKSQFGAPLSEKNFWTSQDPFVYMPLLPLFIYQVPKVGEYVHVVYYNTEFQDRNKFYIQGSFSSPNNTKFEPFDSALAFTAKGERNSLPNNIRNSNGEYINVDQVGLYPDINTIGLLGRYNSDILLPENGFVLRANTILDGSDQLNPTFNKKHSFISLQKYDSKTIDNGPTTYLENNKVVQPVKYLIEYNVYGGLGTLTGNYSAYAYVYKISEYQPVYTNSVDKGFFEFPEISKIGPIYKEDYTFKSYDEIVTGINNLSGSGTANFTTDISAGVNRVINCAGLVAGPSINTSSGKGIYDAPSLVAYNANSTAPNVTSPNNGISGYRISSGTSSERITTLGAGVASEVSYNNASIINNYELQLFSGKYATKGSTPTTKGYLDYTLYNGYSESTKHNTSNYVGINSSGYRYATFSWAVPCQSPVTIQYSKILFSMTGVTTSNGAATTIYTPNTCPCITASAGLTGAKPILMFYRTQNASDASNSINANTGNTYWINAFSNILDPAVVNGTSVITSGTQVNAAAAYNTDPNTQVNTTTGNINGDNASIDNTYSNGTFNVNVNLIPALTSRLLGPNYYIYCRIGLPMEGSIGFGNITATFS